MPRLHVWFLLGGALTSMSYALHQYVYIPSLTTKRDMELLVEAEKSLLLHVAQRLSSLRTIRPQINAERQMAFCNIQMLREDLFSLSPRLQSAFDKRRMLQELDKMQEDYCRVLRFRDQPLSNDERWKCAFAFCIYLAAFHLILPVAVSIGCTNEPQTRRVKKNIGRELTKFLEIHVDMTLDEEFERRMKLLRTALAAQKQKTVDGLDDASAVVSSQEIADQFRGVRLLWNPRCWIEDVAFWAAPQNPWTSGELVTDTAKDNDWGCKDEMLLNGAIAQHGPECAFAELCEYRFGPQRQKLERDVEDGESRRRKVQMAESSAGQTKTAEQEQEKADPCGMTAFGYASSCREVVLPRNEQQGHVYASLASCGVEKLLFVSESLAIPDVRLTFSGNDRYLEVMHTQYGLGEKAVKKEVEQPLVKAEASSFVVQHPLRLPLFSRESMMGFFGGRTRTGNQRTVSFRVGPPVSRIEDLWKTWMQTHVDLAASLTNKGSAATTVPIAADEHH